MYTLLFSSYTLTSPTQYKKHCSAFSSSGPETWSTTPSTTSRYCPPSFAERYGATAFHTGSAKRTCQSTLYTTTPSNQNELPVTSRRCITTTVAHHCSHASAMNPAASPLNQAFGLHHSISGKGRPLVDRMRFHGRLAMRSTAAIGRTPCATLHI